MDQFPNDVLEYAVDGYYDATDFQDEDVLLQIDALEDSDFEDDCYDMGKSGTDTSAVEARNGKDIQGIPWERLNLTRAKCRETRLKQYKNYENLSRSRHEIEKEYKQVEKGNKFYDFQFNTRLVKSTVVHFQIPHILMFKGLRTHSYLVLRLIIASRPSNLRPSFDNGGVVLRNLLWATSKNDVYLMKNYSVLHWNPLLRKSQEVLNVAKPITPAQKHAGCQALSRVQISTMTVKDNLMVAGGFQGELICKYLHQQEVAFCSKVATGENAITNAVDIYHNYSGSTRVVAANNDAQVKIFDTEEFACLSRFTFPWSVNNTSASADGKLLAVLGDSTECLIADAQSGKVLNTLKGHLDYSFASAWHPDGRVLATGNQDTTCRLWDIRNLSKSFSVLKGRMGAIRAIRFTSDGRFMAMAEPADFVHVFDTFSNYGNAQEIDLFGEIAGITFSPDSDALFVGVSDRTYGSLLEFNRRHYDDYLECML